MGRTQVVFESRGTTTSITLITFDGQNWSVPQSISQSSNASSQPAIAKLGNGVQIVWTESRSNGSSILRRTLDASLSAIETIRQSSDSVRNADIGVLSHGNAKRHLILLESDDEEL